MIIFSVIKNTLVNILKKKYFIKNFEKYSDGVSAGILAAAPKLQ